MSFKVVIESAVHATSDRGRNYCRLKCRDQDGRFAQLVCFDAVADAMKASLSSLLGGGDDLSEVSALQLVIAVKGAFQEARRDNGKSSRYFAVRSFEILTGPSAEIFQTRSSAVRLLATADKVAQGGDIEAAYRLMEDFVARIAQQPVPSLQRDEYVEENLETAIESQLSGDPSATPAPVDPEVEAAARMGISISPMGDALSSEAAADEVALDGNPVAEAAVEPVVEAQAEESVVIDEPKVEVTEAPEVEAQTEEPAPSGSEASDTVPAQAAEEKPAIDYTAIKPSADPDIPDAPAPAVKPTPKLAPQLGGRRPGGLSLGGPRR